MIRKGVKMLRLYDGEGKSDDGGVSLEGGERPIHRRRWEWGHLSLAISLYSSPQLFRYYLGKFQQTGPSLAHLLGVVVVNRSRSFVVQMQRRFFVLQSTTAAAALRVKANQNGTDCIGISDEFSLVSMCANKTLMPLIVIKRTQVCYYSDLRPIYRRTAAFQLCLSLLRHDSTGSWMKKALQKEIQKLAFASWL